MRIKHVTVILTCATCEREWSEFVYDEPDRKEVECPKCGHVHWFSMSYQMELEPA